MTTVWDVIIIGAGAAGMMTAIEAGKRGKRVLILEKTKHPGKKILMSGGGRCNFTNMFTSAENFISHNPHFCKSALKRYTPADFISLVQKHGIAFYEKKLGQLFCEGKSSEIVAMLLNECRDAKVKINLEQDIRSVEKIDTIFKIATAQETYYTHHLCVATGGLSIPTLGSSPFAYQLAEQFGLKVYPTRAALVPLTLQEKTHYAELSGVSVESRVKANGMLFDENILFTHRGLSGPGILQISSYWQPGQELELHFLPEINWLECLEIAKKESAEQQLKTVLQHHLPKNMIKLFIDAALAEKPMKQIEHKDIRRLDELLSQWRIKPSGTEGYRTAEVTLGGIDCDELSSQTFEAKKVPGLYFVGEVIDVTGWLGGYNFQWAWSSAWAAGQVI
ncbi:MAG: NAD(P)/FAD-dependent oxidoreductase [Gammaproteobacteria bacterium]|nr:NAD(P)/FAD-dependent oxidoreductase [Gammaproteobacteria bacterium]